MTHGMRLLCELVKGDWLRSQERQKGACNEAYCSEERIEQYGEESKEGC